MSTASALETAAHGGAEPRRTRVLAWLVLALLPVLGAFLPALGGELVYDDVELVAQNPNIRSFASAARSFTSSYWDFRDPDEGQRIGYWRPLTSLWLSLGYELGDGRARPFHALSLAAHLAATAAAFLLALRLLGRPVAAFSTALLFGLHPLHVESVAWISAVNDPLYGALVLLALHAFVRWRDRGSPGFPLGACAWLAAGLLAKEMAAAVLPLALALDLGRGVCAGRSAWRRGFLPFSRAYAPLCAVLVVYVIARMLVFGELSAGFLRTTTHYGGMGVVRLAGLRIEMLGRGLELLVWPAELAVFRMVSPTLGLGAWLRAAGAVAIFAVLAVVLWRRGQGRALAAVLLVPAGLLPALLRVESLGLFPISDRFYYVSVLGIALLLAQGARLLPAFAALPALALVAGAYAWRSVERTAVWRSEDAFFAAALVETPRSPYVHWSMGRVLLERFEEERAPELLDQALARFMEANDLCSAARAGDDTIFATLDDRLQANLGTGACYLLAAELDPLRDYATPREVFLLLTRTFPESHVAWTGLGASYLGLGELDPAAQALERALALDARYPEAHVSLAAVLARTGDVAGAKQHLEQALALRPNERRYLLELAGLEFEHGAPERGRELARRAHDMEPDHPEPLVLLGVMAASAQDYAGALRYLDQALERAPRHGRARFERGRVLVAMGETHGAIAELRRACDALPRDFEAHYLLGALLVNSGAVDAALPFLERAYEIGAQGPKMTALRGDLANLRPDDAGFALRHAQIDLDRREPVAASAWIERALALDPTNARAHYLEGRALRGSRLPEKALASLARALELHEPFFQAQLERGDILKELGRDAEALTHLRRARELGPPAEWPEELKSVAEKRVAQQLAELEGTPRAE